jgi:serine/threonine protein kinase
VFGPIGTGNLAKPAVQTFGKYQILERIATGGMAEIYKARLEGIGGFQRTFAIKRILPHLSSNAEYVAMLVDEAKVAGLLSHANIVQILDLGQVDGVWYIAMEFVDGRDLGNVLRRARDKGLCLPVPHTAFVAIELLKGLEYAHQRQVMRGGRPVPLNIIHRDISPPNVLLSFQGEVKLTDFGIARASHKALETQAGIIKGRFDYMSPEQAAGAKDLDQRSDLFSVGVVLYEMLTGEHPFRAESELGTLDRIRSGRYTPVSTKNSDVPFTLETIVDRALRVDRNERYPSATAFKEALDKFFHDSGFIFTHSTLSAYMRGLYPELRPGAQPSLPSLPTNPGLPGQMVKPPPAPVLEEVNEDLELEFTGDAPTRVIDARPHPEGEERPTVASDGPPPPVPGLRPIAAPPAAFGGIPKEEETLIRSKSSLETDDLAGADLSAQWADEQETQIRPGSAITPAPASRQPAPPKPAAKSLADKAPSLAAPAAGAARAGGSQPKAATTVPDAPTPQKGERSEAAPRRRRGTGVLIFVIAAITFGLGLVVGAGLGVGALQLIGAGPIRTAVAPTPGDAILRVEVPEGAVASVDGQPFYGEIEVDSAKPHTVKIVHRGDTWERPLTLAPGELRVLVFTPTTEIPAP